MKMPNGYGSVTKLKGNRRKPWAIRITITIDVTNGKDHTTAKRSKYLGYYETKDEALNALADYNSHPYNMDANKITFAEVFEKWSAEKYPKISQSNVNGYNAAYKCCDSIDRLKFKDIRKSHLQNVIDTCGKNYPTLKKVKMLFNQLFRFAMENDLCSKNYAQFVDIQQYSELNPDARSRKPFTADEVNLLWSLKDGSPYITVILMLIYSGCRISELLELKKADVHLDERWFRIRHAKTKAGIRQVPIAQKVLPFFQHWMNTAPECDALLSTPEGKPFLYRNFYDAYWSALMDQLSMDHKPHDTRHTCITMMNNAGIPEKLQKRIVGHAGQGVTDAVYTHYTMQQMIEAIDKI